jgi:hypothetical protein
MPQAIFTQAAASIVGFFTSAGAVGTGVYSGAVAATAAVLKYTTYIAAAMSASKLLAPKMPSFSDSSLSDRSQLVRNPISARTIVYGKTRVSGTIVYLSTTGTKNEYLHIVLTLAGHEVEAIDEIYFNDELVPLVSNTPTGFYAGVARVNKKRGVPGDTADADLIADTASLTDGKWTSDHKLSGIAYLYVRLTWDAEKFPSGIPNISAVIRGKKVLDPRTATTAYSANAALCLRDYLTDTSLGMGMTAAEVDDTAFGVAATICEEQVQILPLSPTVYENRYEANGVIVTSASPDENIGKLLSAMGGLIAYTGGRIVPYASAYRIPTVTLTEKHFVGPINVQTRTSARDRVNSVKGVYVSETNNWQVTDFPTISSATYVTADNNNVFFRDVVLPFTTSPSCAQRLAVLELRRAREEITFSARFRLEAMQVRAGDTVMITNEKLGWSSKVFEVMEWNFASDGTPPQVFVDMTLRETASSVYSWAVGDQIAVPDSPNTTLPDPFTLGAPTNLSLTADGTTQLVQADGTILPRIRVGWTPPAAEFIQSGGSVVIEYKPSTSTTYLTWNTVEGEQTEDFISSDVKIGTNYNVRIYGESYFGISTSYLSGSITVAQDTTPPATPTGLTAIAGTGQIISLDWNDNTDADLGEYGVYRNTSNDPGTATEIAQTRASRFVDVSLTLNQQYFYWVTAYDRIENQSAKSTGADATAVAVVAGQTDPTPPVDPAAPTVASTTTYLSSDGTVFAQIVVSVPAFTTRTAVMNVLYRKSGQTGFIVAGQRSTGGGTSSIDDLTPNVSYEIAVQAFSAFGIGSAVVTGPTQLAPSNTTAPAAPIALSPALSPNVEPRKIGAVFAFGSLAEWQENTEQDFAYYEVKATLTNSDAAVDYSWGYAEIFEARFTFYNATLQAGHVRVRSVNRSGVASAWTYFGNANGFASLGLVFGTAAESVAEGNDTRITGAAQKASNLSDVASPSAARANLGINRFSHVQTLTGGAPTETFTFTHSLGTVQDYVLAACVDPANSVLIAHDFADAGNTTNATVFEVATTDGSNISAGARRFTIHFVQ